MQNSTDVLARAQAFPTITIKTDGENNPNLTKTKRKREKNPARQQISAKKNS
jgi:hypothetical protein